MLGGAQGRNRTVGYSPCIYGVSLVCVLGYSPKYTPKTKSTPRFCIDLLPFVPDNSPLFPEHPWLISGYYCSDNQCRQSVWPA